MTNLPFRWRGGLRTRHALPGAVADFQRGTDGSLEQIGYEGHLSINGVEIPTFISTPIEYMVFDKPAESHRKIFADLQSRFEAMSKRWLDEALDDSEDAPIGR